MIGDSFDYTMNKSEYQMRGMYLKLAAEFDFILTEIICLCFIENSETRESFKIIMLENTLMGKKISIAKKVLNIYNESYYNSCKVAFDNLNKFTTLRNKLAHSRIMYDSNQKDTSFLLVEYITKGEIVHEKMNILPLMLELQEYYKDLQQLLDVFISLVGERGMEGYVRRVV